MKHRYKHQVLSSVRQDMLHTHHAPHSATIVAHATLWLKDALITSCTGTLSQA